MIHIFILIKTVSEPSCAVEVNSVILEETTSIWTKCFITGQKVITQNNSLHSVLWWTLSINDLKLISDISSFLSTEMHTSVSVMS